MKGLSFIALVTLVGLAFASFDDHVYYKDKANEAVVALNVESRDTRHWKLQRLVEGKEDRIRFIVTRTECEKDKDNDKIELGLCSVRDDAPHQECTFKLVVEGRGREAHRLENLGCKRFDNTERQQRKKHSHRLRHKIHRKRPSTMEEGKENAAEAFAAAKRYIENVNYPLWENFTAFVERHNKVYNGKHDIIRRFKVYKNNHKLAQLWQENEKGTAVYGETEFMDLSPEEFREIYLPYVWEKPAYPVRQLTGDEEEFFDLEVEGIDELPPTIDWRTKNVVTPVKNQGQCGSCWAFSVTGNIEGQWAIKKNNLVSLSEQELVDCDVVDQGCNGGMPLNAYKEIIRMGGLEPEEEYPYDAHQEKCHLVRQDIAVYINDSVQLPPDENKMAVWLFKNGPISIGINAYPMQFYRHGISHPWKIFCWPSMLNHGVLIVGYGQEGKKPFWIIKNSWGTGWGEKGYYRLYRGKNVCGVNEMATSSIVN